METFSALLALFEGSSHVTDGFPSQKQVTQSFDIFFDVHLNKRLSKKSRRRWLKRPCTHCDVPDMILELSMQHAVVHGSIEWYLTI